MIYLDNNASTPVDPEVTETILSALRTNFGNPSSAHYTGIRAKASVDEARSLAAKLIGASSDEIFFTSGGTESNNLAVIGAVRKKMKGHIITSVIEHPSVINTCMYLKDAGFDVTLVKVDAYGRVDAEDVEKAIRDDTVLITIMHANNETGVLQPIKEIGAVAGRRGIPFHTDAAQSIGKIPVNIQELAVDMMTIASHKFYGPKGIGALYVKKGLKLSPIMFGAGHEMGLRPGTENVPGIIGIGKACGLANTYIKDRVAHAKKLTEMLYKGLKEKNDGIRLNGHETLRLPNTLNICIPGADSVALLDSLKDKVAASSGSACHSGIKKPSQVLLAMGISEADAISSIRLSAGKDNTEEDINEAAGIISDAIKKIRGKSP